MDHEAEIWVKGTLCLLGLLAFLWRTRVGSPLPPGRAGQMLGAAAFAAVLAYYNFGLFHGRGYVHHWETFHYVLGSKYFPELRYDGLYAASLAAEAEAFPGKPLPAFVRDLRTNDVVPSRTIEWHMGEVKRRFTPERWRQFVADNAHFVVSNDPSYLAQIRTDHGYNPTPAWTFVARLFDGWLPVDGTTLPLWTSLDLVLLAATFVFVFRSFGSWAGTVALLVFGLGYTWRFDWVGGAFLRQDWLAASVIGLCMLKRERWAAAGALFGYAASVRLFPAAFLFGPAVLGLRAILRKEETAWLRKLASGFVLSVALWLAAGSLTGRGVAAWGEFGRNFQKHRHTWLTNNVGLKNLLLYGPETFERRLVDFSQPEPWLKWQKKMDDMEEARKPLLALASLAFLGLVAAAAWRAGRVEAALLGIPAFFAAGVLTCYYWVVLVALVLTGRRWLIAGVMAVSVVLFAADLLTPSFEAIYGLASWLLASLFAWWSVQVALGITERPSSDSGCSRGRRTKRGR